MQLHSKYARFFLAGALFPCTPSALAQGLPDKPLRIVTSESAGGNDFVARLIAQALASNRPAIVDNRSGVMAAQVAADLNMPRAVNNRFIDTEASRVSIDARLLELERIAQQTGTAVGIGTRPYPVTIERVAAWAATLDAKGFDLVPVSAIANRQAVR